nr:alpha/beta hydrolase [Verrucomicrobiota bacterium]
MRRWSELLGSVGAVSTLDYDYIKAGRRRPDPLPQLIAAHKSALAAARAAHPGAVVLVGKSMGSRVGCHVSLEENVDALICMGYPLCGGGDPTKLRDQVLRELTTPILFVQGTRDPLCPLEMLERVRGEMSEEKDLFVVKGGDHSLLVTKTQLKASGQTQDEVDRKILETIRQFVATHAPRKDGAAPTNSH